jgi:hypothetical protein
MSFNRQEPYLYSFSSGSLVIDGARSVSVYTNGGTTSVTNGVSQTISLPASTTIELNADSGNTLDTVTVTAGTGTAFVTFIGGFGNLNP